MPLIKRPRRPAALVDPAEPTLATLLGDLASPKAEVRRGAARGLGRYPAAATALCTALTASEREDVRHAIFTALIRHATPAAAEGLVALLGSEDPGLRNGAIEALKTMPDAAAPCVFESMKGGSTDVRIFGVGILGALALRESPRWLIRVIDEDPDVNVCAVAVDGLTECGDDEAVEPLHRLLKRFPNEPYLEFCVQTALSRIKAA